MSFFRTIISRGKSSSRDSTPVDNHKPSSRSGSVKSNASDKRYYSMESADLALNRGETFIVSSDQEEKSQSNTSLHTLEKKSKKLNVFQKFGTFTKRKKSTPRPSPIFYEHHPEESATNTYYNWKTEECGHNSFDYDNESDPFNILYEQSNVKTTQDHNNFSESEGYKKIPSEEKKSDFSTYKKSKKKDSVRLPRWEKVQTHEKNLPKGIIKPASQVNDKDNDADKYKTVTLNSFRKSFREHFLRQHQAEAEHNPSWFVQVKPEADNHESTDKKKHKEHNEPKEHKEHKDYTENNFRNVIIFDNEDYRPGSRSPVRNNHERKPKSRSNTGSPVKRNETFRIEIKNSTEPVVTVRVLPVGVAKPMPKQHTNTVRLKYPSPTRKSTKLTSSVNSSTGPTASACKPKLYQTLVQIKNNATPTSKSAHSSPITYHRNVVDKYRTQISSTVPSSPIASYNVKKSIAASEPPNGKYTYNRTYSAPQKSVRDYFKNNLPTNYVQPGVCLSGKFINGQYQDVYRRQIGEDTQIYKISARRNNTTQQQRILVPGQRRTRSPNKLPWR